MISQYLELGWVIIPCYFKNKMPAIDWKPYKEVKPLKEELKAWFAMGKRNVALLAGKLSGFVVVDFDSLQSCEDNPDIFSIDTFTVKSNRGYHKYFKYPEGKDLVTRVKLKDYPDIDFKMNNSLITAPPSTHASGHKYQALSEDIKLADLPEKVIELCTRKDNSWVSKIDSVFDGSIKSLPIEMVIGDMGVKRGEHTHFYYCYNGHDKETASLKIYPRTNSYYCFGCMQGGNVFSLVSKIIKQNYYSAGKFLQAKYRL